MFYIERSTRNRFWVWTIEDGVVLAYFAGTDWVFDLDYFNRNFDKA